MTGKVEGEMLRAKRVRVTTLGLRRDGGPDFDFLKALAVSNLRPLPSLFGKGP